MSKRIFHPGSGERISGIDFALSKKTPAAQRGVSVVQVKRNRGKKFYEFGQRDIDQFGRFSQGWRSAYYLMVDETVVPPLDCFLMASELEDLLGLPSQPPIHVENEDVRKHCRGSDVFYDAFYACWRGSKMDDRSFELKAYNYTHTTHRILLELFASSKRLRSQNRQLRDFTA